MLEVNRKIAIDDNEFTWSFVRAGGPGGQNVNKVASKAVLRWALQNNESLPADVKTRLCSKQRSRITNEGDLLVTSQKYRDQERNRQDCLDKLKTMILQATEVPKPRKATKPTRGSKERRLQAKKQRSQTKSTRRRPPTME